MRNDAELTKELEVGGRPYQLSKMTATVASRIRNWLLYAFVQYRRSNPDAPEAATPTPDENTKEPTPEELQTQADSAVALMWLFAASALSEETLTKIQNYCLRACAYRDEATGAYIPVLMANGQWGAAGVSEKDAVTVDALITQSLQFSLSPFFSGGGSKAVTPK